MKINIERQKADIIVAGESSRVEFKEDTVHNDRLAIEIIAFANFKGGLILLGVSDSGELTDLTREDNEERILNLCSSTIKPLLIPEYQAIILDGKRIAVITVDTRREKPYAFLRGGQRSYIQDDTAQKAIYFAVPIG
jgi:ATP-dependent DNA helicase RecG